jgi:hypothetical protein
LERRFASWHNPQEARIKKGAPFTGTPIYIMINGNFTLVKRRLRSTVFQKRDI